MAWPKGTKHTPEMRQKMREARRGVPLSPEHRENIAAARLGHGHTNATREKISATLRERSASRRSDDAHPHRETD